MHTKRKEEGNGRELKRNEDFFSALKISLSNFMAIQMAVFHTSVIYGALG